MSATGEEETADYLVVEGNEDLGNVTRKNGYFEFPGESINEPGRRKKFYAHTIARFTAALTVSQ